MGRERKGMTNEELAGLLREVQAVCAGIAAEQRRERVRRRRGQVAICGLALLLAVPSGLWALGVAGFVVKTANSTAVDTTRFTIESGDDVAVVKFENSNVSMTGPLSMTGGVSGATPAPQITLGSYVDNAGAPSPSHIALWSNLYGFGITGSDLDYLSDANHKWHSDTNENAMTLDGNTGNLAIEGSLAVAAASTTQRLQVNTGSANDNFWVDADANVGVELRSGSTLGTPFIDFSNDNAIDYDARLILMGNDTLTLTGGVLDMNSSKITNVAAPTTSGDAANKGYVDALGGGGGENLLVEACSTTSTTYSTKVNYTGAGKVKYIMMEDSYGNFNANPTVIRITIDGDTANRYTFIHGNNMYPTSRYVDTTFNTTYDWYHLVLNLRFDTSLLIEEARNNGAIAVSPTYVAWSKDQ